MTRAIELALRVQVMGEDIHLLQCYLDRNGIVAVVLQPISLAGRVPVKDGSNLGCHVVHRSHIVLGDGSAWGRRSGRALIFSQIENCHVVAGETFDNRSAVVSCKILLVFFSSRRWLTLPQRKHQRRFFSPTHLPIQVYSRFSICLDK
jgi:hypothetical protein